MVQMSDREGCERVIRMLGNTKLHDGKIQLRLVNRPISLFYIFSGQYCAELSASPSYPDSSRFIMLFSALLQDNSMSDTTSHCSLLCYCGFIFREVCLL